ncbi:MAG: hypothetical protein KDE04_16265 [Anaerolineales bacterium]|nr:hypothetical protein [Anaerolineales bacterium]MCB8960884.1 hypothetical protein [Ardenticatenales bacterium]
MIESIQQAVKQHDPHQLEIKLDYELLSASKTKYHISTYIFVPHTLGISPESYPRHLFYRDAQSYIRLKTPALNLREFVESQRSPLSKIKGIIAVAGWIADPTAQQRLITQLKLLSATFASALREHYAFLDQRVTEAEQGEHIKTHHLIRNLVNEFLTQTPALIQAFRDLFADFNLPHVPEQIYSAYVNTDESLSLLVEESAAEMFLVVDSYFKRQERDEFKAALQKLAQQESKHRRSRGYLSVLKLDNDNEAYLSQASRLKKYASSVLFLDIAIESEGAYLMQLIYALAAGLSMVFATGLAFYFQARYGNFTLPVFVALVIGYMFKDRIKELGRLLFARQLEDRLFDRRIRIRTQDGQHNLGVLKEKVRFVSERDLPATVLRDRRRDTVSNVFAEGREEKIICHTREITLNCATINEVFPDFPEITGLNDIWRYDVRHFLNRMAGPEQERLLFHDGQLVPVTGQKVYAVNVISRFRAVQPKLGKMNSRLQLILNRNGIKRIETFPVE